MEAAARYGATLGFARSIRIVVAEVRLKAPVLPTHNLTPRTSVRRAIAARSIVRVVQKIFRREPANVKLRDLALISLAARGLPSYSLARENVDVLLRHNPCSWPYEAVGAREPTFSIGARAMRLTRPRELVVVPTAY